MSLRTPRTPKPAGPPADHPHHWRVESPSGGETSAGTCLTCGVTRDFKNYLEVPAYSEAYAAGREAARRKQEAKLDFGWGRPAVGFFEHDGKEWRR